MSDFMTAFALIFVIEGILYAAFPDGMKRMVVSVLAMPPATLRVAGLVSAVFGLGIVWLLRG